MTLADSRDARALVQRRADRRGAGTVAPVEHVGIGDDSVVVEAKPEAWRAANLSASGGHVELAELTERTGQRSDCRVVDAEINRRGATACDLKANRALAARRVKGNRPGAARVEEVVAAGCGDIDVISGDFVSRVNGAGGREESKGDGGNLAGIHFSIVPPWGRSLNLCTQWGECTGFRDESKIPRDSAEIREGALKKTRDRIGDVQPGTIVELQDVAQVDGSMLARVLVAGTRLRVSWQAGDWTFVRVSCGLGDPELWSDPRSLRSSARIRVVQERRQVVADDGAVADPLSRADEEMPLLGGGR